MVCVILWSVLLVRNVNSYACMCFCHVVACGLASPQPLDLSKKSYFSVIPVEPFRSVEPTIHGKSTFPYLIQQYTKQIGSFFRFLTLWTSIRHTLVPTAYDTSDMSAGIEIDEDRASDCNGDCTIRGRLMLLVEKVAYLKRKTDELPKKKKDKKPSKINQVIMFFFIYIGLSPLFLFLPTSNS